jgi:hypothetical protein
MIARRSGHDPERDAAAYLAGEQRRRARRRFEAHLMECEDCWQVVRLGRAGRTAAEAARELAPPGLREAVRAKVLMSPGVDRRIAPPRVMARVLGVLALATLLGGLTVLSSAAQPEPIAAALAAFRSGDIPTVRSAARSAPDLSDEGLRLVRGGRAVLGGLTVDAFVYASGEDRIFVYMGESAFPEARGSVEITGAVPGWRADDDGVAMVCAETPVSLLIVGTNERLLEAVEVALTDEESATG